MILIRPDGNRYFVGDRLIHMILHWQDGKGTGMSKQPIGWVDPTGKTDEEIADEIAQLRAAGVEVVDEAGKDG